MRPELLTRSDDGFSRVGIGPAISLINFYGSNLPHIEVRKYANSFRSSWGSFKTDTTHFYLPAVIQICKLSHASH